MMIQDNISFQIKGIELLESSLKIPSQPISDQTSFTFNLNLEHLLDSGKEYLIVKTAIDVLVGEKSEVAGSLKTNIIFAVENLMDYLSANGLNLPDVFITTLNSIAISTTRGVMFSQFKGTYLHNAVLPILDPSFKKNKKQS